MAFTDDEDNAASFPISGSGLGFTPDGEALTFDAHSSAYASPAGAGSASDTANDDVEMSDENASAVHSDADMSDEDPSAVHSDNDYCECRDCDKGAAGHGFQTDDYHATNCWDKDCEQCQTRRPGVQRWHVDGRPDCKDPFVEDDSHMVETYVDGFNRVGMMPNRELVNLMKSSAKSGRRFRDLKNELSPEMDEARKQMNIGLDSMKHLKERIQVMDQGIREPKEGDKEDDLASMRKVRRNLRLQYIDARDVYGEQRDMLERMIEALKSEERMWMSTMRRLSHKQDALLTASGLLDDDVGGPEWTDEQYDIESVGEVPEILELEEEVEEIDEAFQLFVQQQADAAQPTQPPTEVETGAQVERKEQNESLERAIDVAREANEAHRDNYKILLARHVAEQTQAGRTATDHEYADEFTYIYLTEGERLSIVLRDAEQALIEFETGLWAVVPSGEYRLELDTTGYHKNVKRHEKDIRAEGFDSSRTLDRARIDGWKEDVPREGGDWAETIVDEPEIIEDKVAVVDEGALDVVDEPEPSPKKRSRKRGADTVLESSGAKKRRHNEDGEASAAPVTRIHQHKYNLRARKGPDPALVPKKRVSRKAKGKDPGKAAAKGKQPMVEDDDEVDAAKAQVAKKSKGKGKQPMIEEDNEDDAPIAQKAKLKGKQPLIQDSDDEDDAAGPSAAKKQHTVKRVRSPSPPASASDKIKNKNRFGDLAEIPLFAPTAISRPLDIGAQLAAGNTICEAEDDGRFRSHLWRKKNGFEEL
ncbi:hypothetical protein HBI81_238040 [Parastagonospora nodorum]|nr:hypothetical protein HBH50_092210 [Parastagonospora nodorum]KAH4090526.1 hypothetical protein HBH48_095970 [Parastagonospora nodorum]KAH4209428.1 hypothetical protein HBI95_075590 [Parastagonospora nodorum]KAH4855465.1 hypothetical protein HBH75_080340 [Parastagonospora nodorum]KAH4981331.1 hypothetical protein HBI76_172460 [Parastagonospora nodorum]